MSWVVSRHLNKSGGNNITYRIGQYNKFSHSGFARNKQISQMLVQSSHFKNFQDTMLASRQANILYNTYSCIDEYTRAKRMYSSLSSEQFFTNIVQTNTNIRNTAPVWTLNAQAIGYGSSIQYHWPIYVLWKNIYAREIIHMIIGRYKLHQHKAIAKKNKWNYMDPLFSFKHAYVSKVLTIIIKNKKYSSMSELLKETINKSLVKAVLDMSNIK